MLILLLNNTLAIHLYKWSPAFPKHFVLYQSLLLKFQLISTCYLVVLVQNVGEMRNGREKGKARQDLLTSYLR